MVKFVEKVADGHLVALFVQTRHGKTTFCRTLTYEALTKYRDKYFVVYVDTEGAASDIEMLQRNELFKDSVLYTRITTNDKLIKFLQKLKEEWKKRPPASKILLIIDSISAPALAQWARSKRYDERGIVSLEKIDAVTRVVELVESVKQADVTPVIVLHPLSEMSVQRQLQQVARKIAEQLGIDLRRQKFTPDQLPEEIILQYQRPVGGKALHYIKEIWLSRLEASGTIEQLEQMKMLSDEEVNFILRKVKEYVESLKTSTRAEEEKEKAESLLNEAKKLKVAKFRIYAWGSRVYPSAEPLVDLYLLDLLDTHLTTYRILVSPRSVSQMRFKVL